MVIFFILVVTVLGAFAGLTVFGYLRASFDLLEEVTRHPVLWKQLGEPRVVHVRDGQTGYKTLQPILPWLSWVWRSDASGLDAKLGQKLAETGKLLHKSTLLMAMLMVATAGLMLSAI